MIMKTRHYLLRRIRHQLATETDSHAGRVTPRPWLMAMLAIAPFAAHADLNLVPGMTPAQASAAAGTQRVYEALRSRASSTNNESTSLSADEQSLFEIARELVETSNEQQSNGFAQFSLGLTVEGLRNALHGG